MCVQALLSYRLSPALVQVEGGKVERLKDWIPRIKELKAKEEKRISSSSNSGLDDDGPTLSSIEAPTPPTSHGSIELDIDDAEDEDEDEDEDGEASDGLLHACGGVMKMTKTPWAEEDIRFLIELRAMGMTHSQTAVRSFFFVQFLIRQIPSFLTNPLLTSVVLSHSPVSGLCPLCIYVYI